MLPRCGRAITAGCWRLNLGFWQRVDDLVENVEIDDDGRAVLSDVTGVELDFCLIMALNLNK
jgi:hypothetical protein